MKAMNEGWQYNAVIAQITRRTRAPTTPLLGYMDVDENPSKNWWNTGTRVVGYGRFALCQIAPGQAGPCMLMSRSLWALCQWPFATIWWRGNGTYIYSARSWFGAGTSVLYLITRDGRSVRTTRALPFPFTFTGKCSLESWNHPLYYYGFFFLSGVEIILELSRVHL